jgi:hypothetical protein
MLESELDNATEMEPGPRPAVPAGGDRSGEADWSGEFTPRQIVAELDKYIVGQDAAKRAVAIALRNAGGGSGWRMISGRRSCPTTSS